jgi:hypothetical protein
MEVWDSDANSGTANPGSSRSPSMGRRFGRGRLCDAAPRLQAGASGVERCRRRAAG